MVLPLDAWTKKVEGEEEEEEEEEEENSAFMAFFRLNLWGTHDTLRLEIFSIVGFSDTFFLLRPVIEL